MLHAIPLMLAHCGWCSAEVGMFPTMLSDSCTLTSARILSLVQLSVCWVNTWPWQDGGRGRDRKARRWHAKCGEAGKGSDLLAFALLQHSF